MIDYVREYGRHALELGGGVTIITGDEFDLLDSDIEVDDSVSITGTLGYRYQIMNSGFQLRTAFTPFVIDGKFYSGLGVSMGYRF